MPILPVIAGAGIGIVKPVDVPGELSGILYNVFRAQVAPTKGSVVYCDLISGIAEHSGIYVGDNEIVQLSGSGEIKLVDPKEFVENTTGMSIYVSCYEDEAVGDVQVAERARSQVGRSRDYNLFTDNCHQFSAGCLTGDFENSNNFLWMLMDEASNVLGCNTWRVWSEWELVSSVIAPLR